MLQRFCDECGGEITYNAVQSLQLETSRESNIGGINFIVTVEGIDICHPCLVKLIVNPQNTICKRLY